MGQYWKFVCMDNRQATKMLGKLGEILFNSTPNILDELLSFSACPDVSFPLPGPESTPSTIEKLPIAVLDRICLYLGVNDLNDLLFFALSSHHFLEPAHRSLFKIASWAGKRIICIGDYAYEYPQDFLTRQEISDMGDECLYNYVDNFGPFVNRRPSRFDFDRVCNYARGLPEKSELLDKLFSARVYSPLEYNNRVLRNLTTKEYILASEMQNVQEQTGFHFGFGNVLLCLISWSTDPSVSLRCTYDIHQGPWAGNRFDITLIDNVDGSWRDVSAEVFERVVTAYHDDSA